MQKTNFKGNGFTKRHGSRADSATVFAQTAIMNLAPTELAPCNRQYINIIIAYQFSNSSASTCHFAKKLNVEGVNGFILRFVFA
jgi:hypothetical protein